MLNEGERGVKNGGHKALRGAEAPLIKDIACFVVIGAGVLFLLFRLFPSAIAFGRSLRGNQ